jgi:hypothetical protein
MSAHHTVFLNIVEKIPRDIACLIMGFTEFIRPEMVSTIWDQITSEECERLLILAFEAHDQVTLQNGSDKQFFKVISENHSIVVAAYNTINVPTLILNHTTDLKKLLVRATKDHWFCLQHTEKLQLEITRVCKCAKEIKLVYKYRPCIHYFESDPRSFRESKYVNSIHYQSNLEDTELKYIQTYEHRLELKFFKIIQDRILYKQRKLKKAQANFSNSSKHLENFTKLRSKQGKSRLSRKDIRTYAKTFAGTSSLNLD